MKAIPSDIKQRLLNVSLAFFSGILGFLAFPPFDLGFTAWFCMVPLLFVVRKMRSRDAFFYSFIAGVVFFGGVLYWLVNVTVPGMIILVLVLSLFYAIFGVIACCAFKYSMDLMLLPFVWVVLEYIRSNLFTGFPWALIGLSQYETPNLIQIADITGVYGVSFLIIAFNVGAFAFLSRSKRRIGYTMTALLFILVATSYGIYRSENYRVWGSPRISVVQGNIPQRFKWDASFAEDIVRDYSVLTKGAAEDAPDIVIWPETSYPYLINADGDNVSPDIGELSGEIGIPILAGVVFRQNGKFYNSAALFRGDERVAGRYDKMHLVPFGEYIPFEDKLSLIRDIVDKPIGDFGRGEDTVLFPVRATSSTRDVEGAIRHSTTFYRFGVMICFEDIFPYIAREFVSSGANFLVNITNDAWFGKTAASRQHLQASVFRAVENKVPVIRAANTGISCFIDPFGEVSSVVESDGEEIFVSGWSTANINVIPGRTYYCVYGDTFAYFCGFMMLLLILAEVFLVKREKSIPE